MRDSKGITGCKAHCKVCFNLVDAKIFTTNKVLSSIEINCKDCSTQRNTMVFGDEGKNEYGSYDYKGCVISPVDDFFLTMRLVYPQPMQSKKHKTLKDARTYIDHIMEKNNYIQEITKRMGELLLADKDGVHPLDEEVFEYYALLVLTVGENCTNENVHDAWAMWAIKNKPDHKWIKPFDQIPYSIQLLDCKFRDIVIQVAKGRVFGLPKEGECEICFDLSYTCPECRSEEE